MNEEDGPDDETGMDHKRFGEVCQSDEKDDMDPLSFENVTKFKLITISRRRQSRGREGASLTTAIGSRDCHSRGQK